MSDPRTRLKIKSGSGVLEIDPFHDEGHVVLRVETSYIDGLRPGQSDVSLSLDDLRKLTSWIETHQAIWKMFKAGAA